MLRKPNMQLLRKEVDNMKVGKKGLKMSSGEVHHFASEKKRDNFEKVAQAVKHNPELKAKLAHKK